MPEQRAGTAEEPTPETPLTPAAETSAAPPLDTRTLDTGTAAAPATGTAGLEQLHCPNCGSTQLSQDSNGVWHCAYCRATFRADDPRMIVVSSADVQRAERAVIDTADLLTAEQEAALIKKFDELDTWYHVVIVLETVNTITENVDYYARRRAQELGVGDAATDNGIYLLIVGQPHHVQVEVGTGLAPYVSHDFIQSVVDGTMIPAFRSGDYVSGVGQGATQLAYQAATHGSAKPAGVGVPGNVAGWPHQAAGSPFRRIFGWVVVAIILFALFGGGGAGLLSVLGGGLGGVIGTVSNYDGGGGDSGFSDGGGDFGGGDFGGGSSGGGDW